MRHSHPHRHYGHRVGWLRAAMLGANDGIVSIASLVAGMATAQSTHAQVLLAGIAGLAGGALSMAAGEYVSVSSQADTQAADIATERRALREDPDYEHRELADIYVERGLDRELAERVAAQLTAHDALAAHARDELGITESARARPVQAALASAASFALGGALPLAVAALVTGQAMLASVAAISLACLAALGAIGARLGGASPWRGAARVVAWSILAMAVTAGIGHVFGVATTA
ncbi:MAG: VIT family protein [Thermomonas sp.]